MNPVTLEFLTEQLELADQLLVGRDKMFEPQDLPGRYGRAIKAIDHLLAVTGCQSVLAGGWAVWHHGFTGRITQDVEKEQEEWLLVPLENSFQGAGVAVMEPSEQLGIRPGLHRPRSPQ